MKNKKFLLILLLLLGVGFATVTTTLYINGTVNIKKDETGFASKVVFKTVKLNDATSDQATITDNGKKITFTIPALKSIDETATIKYTIENTSQYKAKLGNLSCSSTDATATTYLSVTPSNILYNTEIEKNGTSAEDTLTITMIRSYAGVEGGTGTEEKTFTYECTLPVEAVETN